MFTRDPGIPWNLSAVCAAVLLLAAVSFTPGPGARVRAEAHLGGRGQGSDRRPECAG